VVAPDAHGAAALVADVLGVDPGTIATDGVSGVQRDLAACDLLRRVNRLTALTEGPERVAPAARRLRGVLDDVLTSSGATPLVGPPLSPPLVPAGSLPWARRLAAATAGGLRAAGYAVHGDPDALAPTDHRRSGNVDRERTLELAVAATLRIWDLTNRPPGGSLLEEGAGHR
jgi:hypothetical protein